MRLAVPVFTILLLACGCGGSGGGDDNPDALDGLVSIAVTPADQTLVIVNGQPARSAYTAMGTFDDGRVRDITPLVQFTLEQYTLGVFELDTLTTANDHGGRTNVVASAAGVQGATGVTIRFQQTYNDPASNLPGDPAGPFAGPADAARTPQLVYPNAGVVLPPNLGRLELHFRPGAANTLFELTFANTVTDLKIYLRCTLPMNGGCIYQPDPLVWSWLAATNRGGETVAWSLRATDDAGTGVGASSQLTMRFPPDDVTGGIYYWTTTLRAIMRYDFGSQTQTVAEKFIDSSAAGGACIGCHALSRDGKKMVAEAGGQNDGRILLLDVATKQPIVPFPTAAKSNFESWNPDGSAYVGVYGDTGATNFELMMFDGNTGALTGTVAAGGTSTNPTNHPDWSPIGDRIAYVNVGVKNTLQMMYNGEIRTVANVGGAWQPYQVLVPRAVGKNRYYPAFAPDGKVLVFNESTCANGSTGGDCDADTDPSAKLFAIDAIGGGTTTALANANAPGIADNATTNLANSFPKWNPFVFRRDGSGGRMGWVTFSSTRKYGLRSPPGNGTLLWMAAVDLDAPAGTDPSATAFALPFQDLATSNHIAQWTTQVVPPLQ
ncbi:MAG: hypothetical protein M4D80_01500 [Myxococcota bacterium]|nr:hypothetical protein [Myxococcota bacterium]